MSTTTKWWPLWRVRLAFFKPVERPDFWLTLMDRLEKGEIQSRYKLGPPVTGIPLLDEARLLNRFWWGQWNQCDLHPSDLEREFPAWWRWFNNVEFKTTEVLAIVQQDQKQRTVEVADSARGAAAWALRRRTASAAQEELGIAAVRQGPEVELDTTAQNQVKRERAPPFKAGPPPSDNVILKKADEMKAKNRDGYWIASKMRFEPGFENVSTTMVRSLIKGRYPPSGRPKTMARHKGA